MKTAMSADRHGTAPTALGNAFALAADSLWSHKLRSALTVLGIVIGIAAVVLVGATLQVVRDTAIRTTTQTFGADTFILAQVASVGDLSRKELADRLRRNPEIYRREAHELAARIRDTTRTAATLQTIADVKAGNRTFLAATILGSDAALQDIRDIRLDSGRFFTEDEGRRAAAVAVIGRDLAKELFPFASPLGKQIRIRGRPFAVIGVQEKQGSSFASSLDRNVYLPLTAFEKIWGSRRSTTVYARPREGIPFALSQEEARTALRIMRHLKPNVPDNFDILIPEAGRSFLARLAGIIGVAIVPISSVALVVAGIVVMNMMLVSVTERTREIGVRKALGARNRDVLAQILFESGLLTVLGGAAGLILSYLGTIVLSRAFEAAVAIPAGYAFMALVLSAAIGLGAGYYPARLAARMPPVEALRAET